MRYIIIYFIFFISSVPAVVFAVESPEVTVDRSVPLAATAPDSMGVSVLENKKEHIEKPSLEIVEDTVLPPCDIIFFKSGKIDYCKIVEVTPTNITYKMCDYVDGPSIIVNKSIVKKVRYANGKEEIINTEQQPQQPAPNSYVQPRKDPLSKLALIFSLCGLIISLFAVAGLILGVISLAKIERSKGALRGKGTAIWAICISALILIIVLSAV